MPSGPATRHTPSPRMQRSSAQFGRGRGLMLASCTTPVIVRNGGIAEPAVQCRTGCHAGIQYTPNMATTAGSVHAEQQHCARAISPRGGMKPTAKIPRFSGTAGSGPTRHGVCPRGGTRHGMSGTFSGASARRTTPHCPAERSSAGTCGSGESSHVPTQLRSRHGRPEQASMASAGGSGPRKS